MRIAIDVRCLMNKTYSGVSHYTFNLLKALFELDHENEYVLFYNSSKEVVLPSFSGANIKYVGFKWPNKVLNLLLLFCNWPKIDRLLGGVDIFFMPNLNFISWSGSCRKMIAVHDLSFIRFPEFFNWKMRLWHKLVYKRSILGADIIIADSENTKRDLIDLLGVSEQKIRVVYLGVGEEFKILNKVDERLAKVREDNKLPGKFILCLGTLEPRKNIESAIEAYSQISLPFTRGGLGRGKNLENFPYRGEVLRSNVGAEGLAEVCGKPPQAPPWKGGDLYDLVIAGGPGWKNKNIFKMASGNSHIHFIGYVNDRPALYNLATAFIYPSYYEGFGLPILEAMACGCPVISGNNSSQPEVTGDAGLLVDPYNINEIKKAMEIMMENEEFRTKCVVRGLERVKDFSWEKSAKEVLDYLSPFGILGRGKSHLTPASPRRGEGQEDGVLN